MATTTLTQTQAVPKVYGLGAEFPSAAALFAAAEKVRDLGFRRWDVHSPFPIHGMDAAMGLGKSWLSSVVLVGGITGLLTATCLEMYPALIEYRTVVHGKPTSVFTVPAFFPIMFELTILLSAFTAVGTLLVLTGLPRWYHPVFNWDRFSAMTDDSFFLVIEARDAKFSQTQTRELLEEIGGQNITLIHD